MLGKRFIALRSRATWLVLVAQLRFMGVWGKSYLLVG